MLGFLRARRRRKLRAQPFPPEWDAILERNARYAARLTGDDRARFRGDIAIFIAEKTFVGAEGLEITDEHRVTIAAAAARLVLRLDISLYDRLTEVIVYPGAYRAPEPPSHRGERPISTDRLGESQHWGVVVVSWADVVAGVANPNDAHDVTLHELAHVIDKHDTAADGTPPLRAREDYRAWAEVMSRHFLALRSRRRGGKRVLRDYGATNEAEFFAVATEAYFERPDQLRDRAPDLYEAMRRFYGDPLR